MYEYIKIVRINKFIASATGLSRRAADHAVADGRVTINGRVSATGLEVDKADEVRLDGELITPPGRLVLLLNKPVGYVVSRRGQGSRTIYDLLPNKYHNLKPVGRLDKDSSGLLLLTNDGILANELTHPRYQKEKTYIVHLSKELSEVDRQVISEGVMLPDGLSKLGLKPLDGRSLAWEVKMSEGRNRQIRRSFAALGYRVISLHRTRFGEYILKPPLKSGGFEILEKA